MATNRFGNHFSFTTWGESHGKEIGLVIDGCPPLISLNEADINQALAKRAPGKTPWTSQRKESDQAEILSGVYQGKTTGTPIAIRIANQDARQDAYKNLENVLRPGHANSTYLKKYGIFDYRGGGRASARETAARVAAGAVAEKIMPGVQVVAYLKEVCGIAANTLDLNHLQQSPIFFPDPEVEPQVLKELEALQKQGDSAGGIVEVVAVGVPPSLGDPVYEKLSARLAFAMLSIPASKGFEIGSGFSCVKMKGSVHNDSFISLTETETNFAGGVLGGISNGMPIVCRVAFKPTSSIKKEMKTVTLNGEKTTYTLSVDSRHDPCVAIRAVEVVRAMMIVTLADFFVKDKLYLKNENYVSNEA
jgi:chorismate synthase